MMAAFKRRFTSTALLMLAAIVASSVNAQPLIQDKFVEGTHYQVLEQPLKTAADDKIEVMEIFWYGCGHCYSFEPYVANWKKTAADDVAFMRTPAVWAKQMRSHAVLFYVAEILDLPEAVHTDLFLLLTKESKLQDKDRFAAIFANYGVSKEDFLKAYDSFSVKAKVKQGENRVRRNYKVEGTPEVVVNGKYRITLRMAGGPVQLFEVVDFLIDKERAS